MLNKDYQIQIDVLSHRIKYLELNRDHFSHEILLLKEEIKKLREKINSDTNISTSEEEKVEELKLRNETIEKEKPAIVEAKSTTVQSIEKPIFQEFIDEHKYQTPLDNFFNSSSDEMENFIGKKVLGIAGVIITFIGVIIGLKYAIDKGWLIPQVRIIMGYTIGLLLLAVAVKLKDKYRNYSAIVLSGAMVILYFTTYIAYSQYHFMPQILAFILMVIITIFTTLAAIKYSQRVIAIIGMCGAYAIPFLISNDEGSVPILLTYITIINLGILAVSIYKNWSILHYLSFLISWIIIISSGISIYSGDDDYSTSIILIFSTINFLTFYAVFLIYKLRTKEEFKTSEISIIIINAAIYYGINMFAFSNNPHYEPFMGLFTLWNAIISFIVTYFLYRSKQIDTKTIYATGGLVIIFITLVFPAQFDGNWVTIFWAVEAMVIAFMAYKKDIKPYEWITVLLMFLSFLSWLYDINFKDFTVHKSFFNIYFMTGIIISILMGISAYFLSKTISKSKWFWVSLILTILTLFLVGMVEIEYAFNMLKDRTMKIIPNEYGDDNEYNPNLNFYSNICELMYSMVFFYLLNLFLLIKIKSKEVNIIGIIINVILIALSFIQGLFYLSELRVNYLYPQTDSYFSVGSFAIGIRYIFLPILVGFMYFTYKKISTIITNKQLETLQQVILPILIIWLISSEFLSWMDILGFPNAYKLISILWAVCAIALISIGFRKDKTMIRWLGITFLILIVIKLFTYDLATQTTIFKTILFISIGLIILLISYLYNRFKK